MGSRSGRRWRLRSSQSSGRPPARWPTTTTIRRRWRGGQGYRRPVFWLLYGRSPLRVFYSPDDRRRREDGWTRRRGGAGRPLPRVWPTFHAMPRSPDRVTVGVPIGAHLLSRLDAVAGDLGLDRADALHAALLCWLEQAERTTAGPQPHAHDTCVDEDRRAPRVRTPTC